MKIKNVTLLQRDIFVLRRRSEQLSRAKKRIIEATKEICEFLFTYTDAAFGSRETYDVPFIRN